MSSFNFMPRDTSDRSHMETVSALRQKFPVDTDHTEISFCVDHELPERIGIGLLLQGCTQVTSSVVPKGGIDLFPAAADVRLARTTVGEEKNLLKAQEVFRALTEHQRLSLAHFEVTSEKGFYTDFRLAVLDQVGGGNMVYELASTSEDGPIGELNSYYLTTFDQNTSEPGPYFEIDEELAVHLIDALIAQQQPPIKPQPGNLQAKLQQVIESSKVRAESSAGKYLLPGSEQMSIMLERHKVINRGLAKVASYSVYLEQQATSFVDGVAYETPRGLSLDYDDTMTPPYEAYVHASFVDPNRQVELHTRDQIFDEVAATFRRHPEEFFRTLSQAAARLTEI